MLNQVQPRYDWLIQPPAREGKRVWEDAWVSPAVASATSRLELAPEPGKSRSGKSKRSTESEGKKDVLIRHGHDSFFKTLIDHEVTVELKNDIQIRGTLKSVDQYLNIKLDDISVVEELKYPHLVGIIFHLSNTFAFPLSPFSALLLPTFATCAEPYLAAPKSHTRPEEKKILGR